MCSYTLSPFQNPFFILFSPHSSNLLNSHLHLNLSFLLTFSPLAQSSSSLVPHFSITLTPSQNAVVFFSNLISAITLSLLSNFHPIGLLIFLATLLSLLSSYSFISSNSVTFPNPHPLTPLFLYSIVILSNPHPFISKYFLTLPFFPISSPYSFFSKFVILSNPQPNTLLFILLHHPL